MTTPNIEELRLLAQTLEFSDAVRCSIQRAADLLQSQAERIKELEEEIVGWREDQKENIGVAFALQREVNKITSERDELREKYTDTYWALNDAARENTSLRAQLTEIAATEPVAWVRYAENGNIRIWTSASDHSVKLAKETGEPLTPLFTRPMPAQDVTELVDALEMIVSTHQGHCEHHVGVSKHSYNLADIAEEALSKYKGAK